MSAARPQPGVRPVRGRECEQRRRCVVEIRAQLPELASLTEERAEPLLVAPAFREELLAPLALEVAPLADEDRRDVELLRDDAQVRAQGEPDLLGRRQFVGNLVERGVEGGSPVPGHLPEQVGLAIDVGVERALLDAHRLREVADRRAVVALLGEEPGRLAG